MTETPTPIPPTPIFRGYIVIWNISKGGPIYQGERIPTNESGLPIISSDDTTQIVSPEHTEFEWNDVQLEFDNPPELGGYRVSGTVHRYFETTTDTGIEISTSPVDAIFTFISITSTHQSNNNWYFNGLYGGVGFNIPETPVSPSFTAGLDGDTTYIYTECFEKSDFSFYPRNSTSMEELKTLKVGGDIRFPREPLYPDLKDPDGNPAPIYPMDIITSFVPDTRDSVMVTYTVKVSATDIDDIPLLLLNDEITIQQEVFQDTNDWGDLLKSLLTYCNFANPGDIDLDAFSEGYPYTYPYTLVSGFEGVKGTPTKRGEDDNHRPLQRGDIWYDPLNNKRYYYNTSDTPDRFKIKSKGKKYKDKKDVVTSYIPDTSCGAVIDRFPAGLTVDIKTKDGGVVEVTTNQPGINYEDGDIIAILSGNNDALIEVKIDRNNKWTTKFISRYGLTSS